MSVRTCHKFKGTLVPYMQQRTCAEMRIVMGTEVNGEYGADQIQILEGLEAVRKRPGMYKIGRAHV